MRTEKEQLRYEKNKAWAKANAEKVRASRKKYELANPEKIAEYRNSPEFKQRAIDRAIAYNKKNKEKRKIICKKWSQNNLDKELIKTMRRNADKLKAVPSWENFERTACIYSLAKMLNSAGEEKYHVDHIIPLRSKYVCGLHTYGNLRIITAKENLYKGNKLLPQFAG